MNPMVKSILCCTFLVALAANAQIANGKKGFKGNKYGQGHVGFQGNGYRGGGHQGVGFVQGKPRFQLQMQVQKKSRNVNLMIQNQAYQLTKPQLRQIKQLLQQVKNVALGGVVQPIPLPYPHPVPLPGPGPQFQISAVAIAEAMANTGGNNQSVSKQTAAAMQLSGFGLLQSQAKSCKQANYYSDRVECLKASLQSQPQQGFKVSLQTAEAMILQCDNGAFYSDEVRCYKAAVQASGNFSIQQKTAGCKYISNNQSASACYTNALKY